MSYDAQARLTRVTIIDSQGPTTINIGYNAFGQRASYSMTNSTRTLNESFTYQGDQLSQVAYSGATIATPYTDTYIYTQDGAPLELLRQAQGASSATPYWYVLDGQNNVVALTASSGNVVDSYSYDQWGVPTSVSELVPQQLRYAGYWYDNEVGWYWLSVRSYDPVLERFLQPDPSERVGDTPEEYVAEARRHPLFELRPNPLPGRQQDVPSGTPTLSTTEHLHCIEQASQRGHWRIR